MKTKYVFPKQIKEMAKICFNMLKIIVVKCDEIWFFALQLWIRPVLFSPYGDPRLIRPLSNILSTAKVFCERSRNRGGDAQKFLLNR